MATFFGEVVIGSYRYFDDEDEDAVDNARDASFSFRSVYGKVSRDFLLQVFFTAHLPLSP
jgi:hypothetical protein